MRTRTRAYGGGESKKSATSKVSKLKPHTSKIPVKSKTSKVRKEIKAAGRKVKIVKKYSKVENDVVDEKVFKQSFVNLSPIISPTTISLKSGKTKRESPNVKLVKSSEVKKGTPKLRQRTRSAGGSGERGSTAARVKIVAKPTPSKPKSTSRPTIKRHSVENVGSATKKLRSAYSSPESVKKTEPTPSKSKPKDFKTPTIAPKQKESSRRSASVEKKDSTKRHEKVVKSDEKATKASSKKTVSDDIAMFVRPSLLSEHKKKQVSVGDTTILGGQKRKRVVETYESTEVREPSMKKTAITRPLPSSLPSTSSSYEIEKTSNIDKASSYPFTVLDTPVTSQIRQKVIDEPSYSTLASSKSLSSYSTASEKKGTHADVSTLLSPDSRGVWEIEGRKSTLLEKLWSWSPSFRRKPVQDVKSDEITSGFSYRDDHVQHDLHAASLQELPPSNTGMTTRKRDAGAALKGETSKQLEEETSKLLEKETTKLLEGKAKNADVKSTKHSSRSGVVERKHFITRRCMCCTAVSAVVCALFGALAMMSISYMYTQSEN